MLKLYSYLLLIGFSMTFPFLLGEHSKNLFLIALIAVSPIMMLLGKWKIGRIEFFLFIQLLMMLIIGLINFDTFRISSYLYSFCFVTSFIYLKSQFDKNTLQFEVILKFIKNVVYLYGVVFVLQQFFVIIGHGPILMREIYDNPFKLASLSPEPSHLAIYLFLLMYSYILLREVQLNRKYTIRDGLREKLIWGVYFWIMLTCQSTTAILFVLLIFSRYFSTRTIIKYVAFFVGIALVFTIYFSESIAVIRAMNIIPVLLTLSYEQINSVDHSAAHRIIPVIGFCEWINPTHKEFWVGGGMDNALHFFRDIMFYVSSDPSYNSDSGDAVNLGGTFAIIMDYGIITFGMLCMALVPILKSVRDKTFVFFWCFIALFNTYNTQIFWLGLMLMYIVSLYRHNLAK